MDKQYNFENLQASFKNYLIAGKKLQAISVKNYLSDLRHFFGWIVLKLKVKNSKLKIESDKNLSELIDQRFIKEYRLYLTENNLPLKTVNRRLSTLRKFCSFCVAQGWMKENPTKQISNLKSKIQNPNILDQFESDLQKEKINSQTITSYLNDVQEFLSI